MRKCKVHFLDGSTVSFQYVGLDRTEDGMILLEGYPCKGVIETVAIINHAAIKYLETTLQGETQ